jgi:hypothetical protein
MSAPAPPAPYQDQLGTFEPCPLETLCENCDHPMHGHFGGEGSSCGECPCTRWACKHGGYRGRRRT